MVFHLHGLAYWFWRDFSCLFKKKKFEELLFSLRGARFQESFYEISTGKKSWNRETFQPDFFCLKI